MTLNDRTNSPSSFTVPAGMRWLYWPFAIASMAAASASTGRVMPLDKKSESQLLVKKTSAVSRRITSR